MNNIISVVGKSGSGKTTILEKLIPLLKEKNYKVATIKHDFHKVELDTEGKDTWRHRKAGASGVILLSEERIFLSKDLPSEEDLDKVAAIYLHDADLIITEGFKRKSKPKIEVFRKELGDDLLCTENELLAVVSDDEVKVNVPVFKLEELDRLADLIEEKFLKEREADMFLVVDGKRIPLTEFPKKILISGISGMVKSLKGSEQAKNISIFIRE